MMRRAFLVQTVVFLLVITGGMIALLAQASSSRNPGALADIRWSEILDGRAASAIDRAVTAGIPRLPALDAWIDGAVYALTKDAGPQVRTGCDGWLFLAEEVLEVRNASRHVEDRLRIAAKIRDHLSALGVTLVVLPVPDKAAQAKDELCGLHVADQARARADMWWKGSAEFGLEQVDLVKGWPQPGYWRTDTHWSREGARFAALRTAEAIVHHAGIGDQSLHLEIAPDEHDRMGDLMRLAGLARTSSIFGPLPDRERDEVAVVERTGGLLDETPAPSILLAGSSYSLNSGFIDYLQTAVCREVVQKSLAGGGFAGALLDVIRHNPSLLREVKLVVWEWPMRTLTQPLTEEERRFLAPPR